MSALPNAGALRQGPVPQPPARGAPIVAAAPTPADREPQRAAASKHPFADLLRQQRGERASPPHAEMGPATSEAPPTDETGTEADAGRDATPARPATAGKATLRAATPAANARPTGRAGHPDRPDSATDEQDHSDDPAVAAATPQPACAASEVASRALRADCRTAQRLGTDAAADADHRADEIRTRGRGAARADASDQAESALLVADRASGSPSAADTPFAAPLTAAANEHAGAALVPESAGADVSAALVGQAGTFATPALAHVATEAVQIFVPARLDSADFAGSFGMQVSLLAQDGVQLAELHLNPAETGPVSIHISIDGSAARIDFGADLAATREAIERSLPELAGALRDAGLTLTGGGVSQHAGERGGSGDGGTQPHARAGSGDGAADLAATRPARQRFSSGGVDLYV